MVPFGRGILMILGPAQGLLLVDLLIHILRRKHILHLSPGCLLILCLFLILGGLYIGLIIGEIEWALWMHRDERKQKRKLTE